jgi:hypothetical protein
MKSCVLRSVAQQRQCMRTHVCMHVYTYYYHVRSRTYTQGSHSHTKNKRTCKKQNTLTQNEQYAQTHMQLPSQLSGKTKHLHITTTITTAVQTDAGADMDRQDMCGMTPLHYAAMVGFCATTQALCERGADTNKGLSFL